ncbi:MAG: radical SAM protein [Theionarchaea archaeon]|nr:radical SAM protein [Theionarchaea archaeon]MBU7038812.1 radical SAM protein [Theionarchaea archaeon]
MQDLVIRKKKGRSLVINPCNSRWALFGGVATDILDLLAEGRDQEYIVSALLRKYETTGNVIERDIKWVEEKLHLRGLLGTQSRTGNSHSVNSLLIETTPRCNLSCTYCYIEHRTDSTPLTVKEQASVIDQFIEMGGTSLAFSGGEPLLCPFLFDSAEYASQTTLETVKVITNGTLWTEKEASRAADLNLFVTISLDSLKKEVHETLRGKGHGRVMETIEMLLDHGMGGKMTISTTPTRLNLAEIPAVMDYCIEQGVGTFECPAFVKRGRGKREGLQLAPGEEDAQQLIHSLLEYHRNHNLVIESYYISCLKALASNRGGAAQCPIGESMRVSPAGDVYPCVFGTDFRLGNVREQPLAEILADSEPLARLKAFEVDDVQECTDCVFKYVCSGGCRAVAYDTYGTLYSQSAFCSLHKDMFWEILWSLVE